MSTAEKKSFRYFYLWLIAFSCVSKTHYKRSIKVSQFRPKEARLKVFAASPKWLCHEICWSTPNRCWLERRWLAQTQHTILFSTLDTLIYRHCVTRQRPGILWFMLGICFHCRHWITCVQGIWPHLRSEHRTDGHVRSQSSGLWRHWRLLRIYCWIGFRVCCRQQGFGAGVPVPLHLVLRKGFWYR